MAEPNEDAPSLYGELLKSKTLKSLYLRSNMLLRRDMEAIGKELVDNKSLRVLDLSDNKLRNKGKKKG